MKINKVLTSTFALSVMLTFLTGCRNAGNYVDEVVNISNEAIGTAQKIGSTTDEAARGLGNSTDDGIKFAKERVKACAESAGADAAKQLIETAISSKNTQISQEELLNVSKKAIQECPEVKTLGKLKGLIGDIFLNEQAKSVVSEVKQEFQGQIEFVQRSPQP